MSGYGPPQWDQPYPPPRVRPGKAVNITSLSGPPSWFRRNSTKILTGFTGILLLLSTMLIAGGDRDDNAKNVLVVCVDLKNVDSVEDFSDPASQIPGECIGTQDEAPAEKGDVAATKPDLKVPGLKKGLGLDKDQLRYATIIVNQGRKMGLPERAYQIAIGTALQESQLHNYASDKYPSTVKHPDRYKKRIGRDYDSVGIFQQRPKMGWRGKVSKNATQAQLNKVAPKCLDPAYAAKRFYEKLNCVTKADNCWAKDYYPNAYKTHKKGQYIVPFSRVIQACQGSAFPNAYAKHEQRSIAIVKYIMANNK